MLFFVNLPRPYSAPSEAEDEYSDSCSDSDADSGAGTDTDTTADLDPMVAQLQGFDARHRHPLQHQHGHGHRQHGHQLLDQEDHDMDLVPFDPLSYQGFAAPAPAVHIIPSARTLPSASSRSIPSTTGQYPHPTGSSPSTIDQILAAAPVLDWTPVLSEEWIKHSNTHLGHAQTDRLSFYQFEPQVNRLMFPYGAVIYTGDVQENGKVDPQPARATSAAESSSNRTYSNLVHNALTAGLNLVSVSGPLTSPRTSPSNTASPSFGLDKGVGTSGAKADPRLGGSEMDLIAFTRDEDIWVMTTTGIETQLTFCSRNKKKSDISCGIAEFVMQEEFHRFTNYYWAPSRVHRRRGPPSPVPAGINGHYPTSTSPSTQHAAASFCDSAASPPSSSSTFTSSSQSSSPISMPSPSATDTLPVSATNKAQGRTTERILYLQVSEAMVDLVVIPRQGMHPEYEEYRYPHTGTPNAVSDLQIVEFVPRQHEEDVVPEPLHKRLWGRTSLYKMFPWLEYIVRFGWMPDGESVWVQILDRRQQITAILSIPLECFMSVAEQSESSEHAEDELASRIRVIYEEQSDYWINITDIMYIFPKEETVLSHLYDFEDTIQLIIASERTGYRNLYLASHSTHSGATLTPITTGQYQIVDKQITVDTSRQLVYFTAKRDSVLETHLYVVSFAQGADPGNVKRLTEPGYSHQTTVDTEKSRFLTLYSSLDRSPSCAVMHLRWGSCRHAGSMSVSLEDIESRRPWCPCGCQLPKISSHAFVIREGVLNLSADKIRRSPIVRPSAHTGHARSCSESFMSNSRVDSTLNGLRSGSMNSISGFLASHLLSTSLLSGRQHHDSSMGFGSSAEGERKSSLKFISTAPPTSSSSSNGSLPPSSSAASGVINASHHPVGEFFTFMSSDNVQLHGCLYRPANYVQGQKYPTLVSIYGGPRSQMVTNEYKLPKFLRVFLATRMGHAVVMIDGRGSNDRGLKFEGRLRHKMGQIEIQDQVEGLQFLARPENGGMVDMERIAISGWSYGGYLSLMALAQYPHIFKLAIAGAPVTQWELYNSAYTERYMGLPQENMEGYSKSNILKWVDKFPDSENRLLIAHGLIDENVHFKNTETLAADLIRHNKPHQVQIYPTERHGLRDARVNEHFETLMFYWLKNYL
ncbi:dipeptidylpeptidase [Dissophora globulifera]|nr:dipeptidylpeptidase [Dissophora globulifera]